MEHLNDVERGKTIHVNGILYRVGNKSGEMTEVQNKETKELKAWPSRMMVEVVHNVPQEEESDFAHDITYNPDNLKFSDNLDFRVIKDLPKRTNVV